MWNEIKIQNRCLTIYSYEIHPLINKILIYRNEEFQINNVFKEWKSGWYISLELRNLNYKDLYIKVPFKNINCSNLEILEKIKVIHQYGKIKNGLS